MVLVAFLLTISAGMDLGCSFLTVYFPSSNTKQAPYCRHWYREFLRYGHAISQPIKNLRHSSHMTSAPKPVLTPEDEAYVREVTPQPESVPIPTEQNEQIPTESPAGASLQPAISIQAENILLLPRLGRS